MRKADVIVVGAGAAGAIVASRLAEETGCRVLLLEAGGRSRPLIHSVPLLTGVLANSNFGVWRDWTEPDAGLAGRSLAWPRGRVLGGSTSINGMVWMRGRPSDYERWASAGAKGWGWANVRPAMEAIENGTGPLGRRIIVNKHGGTNPLFDAFLEAGRQAGLPVAEDFNAGPQEGVGRFSVSIDKGRRISTAAAFLSRPPRNLEIVTNAVAIGISFAGSRARSVTAKVGGSLAEFFADEIVLCCGAVNSPKLLMLSGIGDADKLQPLGIEVKQHLPGVGENLQDHISARLSWECKEPITLLSFSRADRAALGVLRTWIVGSGTAAWTPWATGFLLRSSGSEPEPDLEGLFLPGLSTYQLWMPLVRPAPAGHGFMASVYQLRPESRGKITLRSADASEGPRIAANYLAAEPDRTVLREGVKLMQDLIERPAFDPYRGRQLTPEPAKGDAALDAAIAKVAGTAFHPIGTCKMGSADDPMSVVSPELRVHGIDNLRIADASVMPLMTSGNTNAPAMMIGYRCADFVRDGRATADGRPRPVETASMRQERPASTTP